MKDNATAHSSSDYDRNIRRTIPFCDQLHEATINIVSCHKEAPTTWIDIGCGTGTFVEKACGAFPSTKFILADPSSAMLDLARDKLRGTDNITILEPATAELIDFAERADVVTAVQSLHYLDAEGRRRSIQNCYRLLREGGIFVTFENIKPLTEKGIEIGKLNWQRFEVRAGKAIEEARRHVDRFDVEFFPITIEEHLRLLREAKFSVVELLWYSYVQAGFYCIK